MSETQINTNANLQLLACDDEPNDNRSQTSHKLTQVNITEEASQEDMSTIGDINNMPQASKSIGQSHNEKTRSTDDGNPTKSTKTNDIEIQKNSELKEVSIRAGVSKEDKNTTSDINYMPERYDGNKQNADESAYSTDDWNPNRNVNTSNELKKISTIGGVSQEGVMPINKMLMRVLLQLIIFHTKLPVMGMKTSANKDLDDQQIANTTFTPSRPDRHDAKAQEAVPTQSMAKDSRPGAKLKALEDDKARRNEVGDDESNAEMEQRLLKQITERCASMEETIQRNQKKHETWNYYFVSIIVIVFAVNLLFFNEKGNASPVSDSRLKEVEKKLSSLQGSLKNYKHFQTLPSDVGRIEREFSSKLNAALQELRGDIEMTLSKCENVKKEVDDLYTTFKETDNKIDTKFADMDNNIQNKMEDVQSRFKKFEDMDNNIQNKMEDVQSRFKKFEDLPEGLTNMETQMEQVKGDVRSTKEYAEKSFAAANEDIGIGKKQIIQLNETLETLDHELNITTGKLNRTKEIQDIIHINTFDKGSLIIVMLIMIVGLAALGFYVCVYKPWQPRNFSQSNASEAQQALNAVPLRPVLGSTVCIISFNSNRSAGYQTLVRSALSTSGCTDTMHDITRHSDISRLPHCKVYIMCVEFSERHVIIEEPGLALGDMKRTTYEAVEKLGGVLVILYVNHRGSSRIQNLYSTEIYCVNRQPQLKTLETRNRFISTYDQLNDRQKVALKQALTEALN